MKKLTYFAITIAFIFTLPAHATCVGIDCSCSITASSISFGSFSPFTSNNIDSSGTIEVTCGALALGANVAYNITLDTGLSGNYATRAMSNGSHNLNYNLYTDPSRSTVWGDGSGATGVISNSYLLNLLFDRTDNFTVYARAFGDQSVSAGAYTDSITATVEF